MTRRHLPASCNLLIVLRRAWLLGLCTVLALPAARHACDWLGWLPLWLVLMPGAALWVAEGMPLPALPRAPRLVPVRAQAVRFAEARHRWAARHGA